MRMLVIAVFALPIISCLIEAKDRRLAAGSGDHLNNTDAQAQSAPLDYSKICTNPGDCEVIDQDCCNTGNFIVINKIQKLAKESIIDRECRAKKEQDKELCKDKVRVFQKPQVDCVNNQCMLPTTISSSDTTSTPGTSDSTSTPDTSDTTSTPSTPDTRAACEPNDYCEVVDRSCCGTYDDLIAIKALYGSIVRREIIKACNEKRAQDKDLCLGKSRVYFPVRKTATCIDKQCQIQ